MFFDERRIVIDESLDPEENPAKEGRYRFTLAHEGGGHWRLQPPPICQGPRAGRLVRRAGGTLHRLPFQPGKERVEWQADFYASCLLMPRKLVFTAWDEMFPDRKQRVLRAAHSDQPPLRRGPAYRLSGRQHRQCEAADHALDRMVRPLAQIFLVSPIAMRIRLEKLGLLLREVPHQGIFAGGA